MNDLITFAGRFHPLLIHLPIGILVVLLFLELLSRSKRHTGAAASRGYLLALAVPASILSAALGWFLSREGGYDSKLLSWHFWTGVATAGFITIAAILHYLDLKKPYRILLGTSVLFLIVASHFGGSLTHGSDYLVAHAPGPLKNWFAKPASSPVQSSDPAIFTLAIQPILEDYCTGCHGPEKSKGDLRLDSHPAILKGGEHGPILVSGKPADSKMIQLMTLPETHEDHMPPEGKPQPTEEEVALLEWWISAGASDTLKLSEAKLPGHLSGLISEFLPSSGTAPEPESHPTTPPKPLQEILTDAQRAADTLNIAIAPVSQSEPWLQINASVAGADFGDAQLGSLSNLFLNIRWLDIGGTAITDSSAAALAAMPNLERLYLQRTAISDATLERLTAHRELSYLNLYGTGVTDAGVAALQQAPALRQLYLWQTQATPAAVTNFINAKTDHAQIRAWEKQIAELQENIRGQRVKVELGLELASAAPAAAANTTCPVSGKPVDPAKTTIHDGKTIAFCCDDCRAAFVKDPAKYAAALAGPAKPVNTKCPVSGKDADASCTAEYEGKTVAFCCADCRKKFTEDPKTYAAKISPPTP